jgi:predicted site-specific integrase-resolvase
MKLADWARKNGISYLTAWRWFNEGKMPVPCIQAKTGTILVTTDDNFISRKTAIYTRVSSQDQKQDLDRQVGRVLEYANKNKLSVDKTVKEIGSGLNGKRTKLKKLLSDKNVTKIIIEHKDRLARFGVDYIESALNSRGCELIVVDDSEMKDDLVQDMVDLLTSLCARFYGKRSAKNRAKKAMEAIENG